MRPKKGACQIINQVRPQETNWDNREYQEDHLHKVKPLPTALHIWGDHFFCRRPIGPLVGVPGHWQRGLGFAALAPSVVVASLAATSTVVVEESAAPEMAAAPPPVSSLVAGAAAEVVELRSAPPPPPSSGAWGRLPD
jgi:hypothetical protein